MRVLTGQCFEPDRAQPYAPLCDLVRTNLLRQGWADEPLAAVAPDLVDLLPELAGRPPSGEPTPTVGLRPDQRRIVHATIRLVEAIAAQTPLLLIVEDAHWSDDASLDLLVRLARFVRGDSGRRIMLVVTFRGDEVSAELAAALVALDRERLAAEVRLGPLPRPEVVAMIRSTSDTQGAVGADLAESIYRLSEGNPFFVEELLRSALATGVAGAGRRLEAVAGTSASAIPLPRSVSEAVRRRVDHLSDGARQTLTVAAVSGRRFDFALLQALSGCDEIQLLERVKELVAARLVVEESADRFAFRHALMRQAIYDGLLARERRLLHRRALETILEIDPAGRDHHAADLTRHAVEAGAWEEALHFGERAGEQALAFHAPIAAIELLGCAIAAADQLGRPPPPALLQARGRAHETRGDFEAARSDYEAAGALAQAAGSVAEESEALLALGGLWAGRDYEQTGPYVRQALELARVAGDRSLVARSLNRLGNWHANQDDPIAAFRLHEEALAICEATGNRRGLAETLDLLGMARYLVADFDGSAAAVRRAIPLLRELDDRRTLVSALATLSWSMSSLDVSIGMPAGGSHEEGLAIVAEAVAVAQEIDARSDEALAHCCAALIVGERRADAALEHARRALRIAEEIGHRQWVIVAHLALGDLFAALLDAEAARCHLEAALTTADEVSSSVMAQKVRAELALRQALAGDPDAAQATIAAALSDDAPMVTQAQRDGWFSSGWIALVRGHPGRALAIADRLIAAATSEPIRDLPRLPDLAWLRGEALAAIGRTDEALESLDVARDGATAREHLPLLWRVQLARAKLLRGLGRRVATDEAVTAAHAAAASYAAGVADASLRETFLTRVAATFPPPRILSPRQASKAAYDGLTSRELAVATLVATGRSNREIGDALFMSERTAATHVGNILGKLGVKSRAQIAAWAQERGLTSDGAG
jgi:DNA-binding CsgD family transcriptional regulator